MNAVDVDSYIGLWDKVWPEMHKTRDAIALLLENHGFFVSKYLDESKDEFTMGVKVGQSRKSGFERELEFRLVSASMHEGEAGANIRIMAFHKIAGEWVEFREYQPFNFTDRVWTTDAKELLDRFGSTDFGQFTLDMLE